MTLLDIRHLHLWRGEQHVLRDVSFSVGIGQCLQLTGPNGAGKSTLLRAVAGLLPMAEGELLWRGADCSRNAGALQRECAYLGHLSGQKGELSALENLAYLCGLRRHVDEAGLSAALDEAGVRGGAQRRPLRQLSAGQQRRVSLARVQLLRAPLWLLDEPVSNLDTQGQALFATMLSAHLAAGGLAVIATHQPLPVLEPALLRLELAA